LLRPGYLDLPATVEVGVMCWRAGARRAGSYLPGLPDRAADWPGRPRI